MADPCSSVFEIAASLGQVRLQSMPVPQLGPTHSALVQLAVGRGERGVVTLGEKCRIIAPVVGESALSTVAEDLRGGPADMIEWRVDLFEPFRFALTADERVAAAREGLRRVLASSTVPVLATIRTVDEGGAATLSASEYAELVRVLAQGADAIDVQMYAPLDASEVRRLIRTVQALGAVVVASHHDFNATPPEDEILGRLYAMKQAGADVVKVAYHVDGPAQSLAVMNAQMRARTLLHAPVIAIGMGGAGALTRIGGSAIGSAATFATIGPASAPGQFTAAAVREALDLLEV